MMKQNTITSLIFLACSIDAVQGFLFPHTLRTTPDIILHPSAATTTTQLSSISNLKKRIVEKSETEWRETLTTEQYYVLREEGTEAPNTSYLNTIESTTPGTFQCAGCGSPLFTPSTKFDSGTGWPSFYSPIDANAVELSTDFKMILPRTECSCRACGGHLGHVFSDGPDPTGQRFCLNGVAMTFLEDEEDDDMAKVVLERGSKDPYVVGVWQVLPEVLTNMVIGGLFLNSFIMRLGMEGGVTSPLDAFPLFPAVYFGVLALKNARRMLP